MINGLTTKTNLSLRVSILLSIAVTIVKWPFRIQPIDLGLDPSWMIGLAWAAEKNKHWGQDILFTYGPLYWLMNPTLVVNTPKLFVAFLITFSIFTYSVWVLIHQLFVNYRKGNLPVYVLIIAVLILFIVGYGIMDVTVVAIILHLGTLTEKYSNEQKVNVVVSIIILAIISLCKFSYIAVALSSLCIYSTVQFLRRNFLYGLMAWLVFISTWLAIWILAEQKLALISPFIRGSFAIAQGFSEAMSTPLWTAAGVNNSTHLLYLIIAVAFLLGIGLLFLISVLRKERYWFMLLLSAPVAFLAFKEGFVRLDVGHYTQCFGQLVIMTIGYVVLFSSETKAPLAARLFIFLALVCSLPIVELNHIDKERNLALIFSNAEQIATINAESEKMKNLLPLENSLLQQINRDPVDIIPYDISLLYIYKLNWSPRPIIQSYSAYTAKLDSINSRHFAGGNAPKNILYFFKSIDDRYPLFDEPGVFTTLTEYYEPKYLNKKDILLLQRRPKPRLARQAGSTTYAYTLNQSLPIPKKTNAYTQLTTMIELTFLGKLVNLLCNVPALTIEVYVHNQPKPIHTRLLRQLTPNGLLISHYATSIQDVIRLFSGTAQANVDRIVIQGNPLFYKDTANIHFTFTTHPGD